MTQNRNLKRRVRARAAKTGESYTAALRHFRRMVPDRADPVSRPRLFRVARRYWLRRDLQIVDAEENVLFTASWRAGFPTGTWTVRRNGTVVAQLRRKLLVPLHSCVVTMNGQSFLLRNKPSLSRVTVVESGPYDGAALSGNLADMRFRIEHRGILIAEAESAVLSMVDRLSVRLISTHDPAAEALAALMMIDLLVQKREES